MSRRIPLSVLAGFFVVYVFWGATFLAIKIGDATLPPLLLAALRFLLAGGILYGWGWGRGWPHPRAREWGAVALVSVLMFLIGYGVVFWAETRVSSGMTAVIVALVPLCIAGLEAWVWRTEPASARVLGGCLLGVAGMAVLMSGGGAAQLPAGPVTALILASLAWAVGTVLMVRLPMPAHAGVSAAAQMLVGGAMLLAASAASGELRGLHWASAFTPAAVWSLLYLVLPGSVLAYGVFVWLLERVAAVHVATYALVNPVVALLLGWEWGGEALHWPSLLGTAIILGALALVLGRRSREARPPMAATQLD
ncbi:MAG: EamA family transporter [Terriglobales bacterium]